MNLYRIETSVMTLNIAAGTLVAAIKKAKEILKEPGDFELTPDEQRIVYAKDQGKLYT